MKPIVLIDNTVAHRAKYFSRLKRFFKNNNIPYLHVRTMKEAVTCNANTCCGFILSGSSANIHNMSQRHHDMNMHALQCGVPVLGICFGAQFILTHLKGSIAKMPALVCGNVCVHQHTTTSLTKGLSERFNAAFCAQYVPVAPLPPSLRLTMVSPSEDATINHVVGFQHSRKPWFGVAFHPEGTPETHVMLRNFIKLCQKS